MSQAHHVRGLRAVVAGLVCVVLSGCWWQQPGAGPEDTRHNAFENALTADSVAGLTEKWSVQVPGAVPEPVTSGTLLYLSNRVAGAPGVTALDVRTGTIAWQRSLPTAVFAADPLPVAFSGAELWVSQVARSPFINPQCADITRLDPATGEVLGTRAVELPTTAFVTSGDTVAYIDTTRCSTGSSARLVVLDRRTTATSWTARLDAFEIDEEPIIADGRIYAGGLVFDADGCGAPVCDPVSAFSTPRMASGGRVFAFENSFIQLPPPDPPLEFGAVRVHSADTGQELWRDEYGSASGPDGPDGAVNGIAVGRETLYVAGWQEVDPSPGRLAAYPVGGCGAPVCGPAWTAPADHRDAGQPAVAGDVVYTLSPDGLTAYAAHGCGAAVCAPLVHIAEATPGERTFIVSAGHVFLVNVTNLGTPEVSTTITAYGLP